MKTTPDLIIDENCVKSDKMKVEFFHLPGVSPHKDQPFAIRISGDGHEMGIWLPREDVEAMIIAMQKALLGETQLSDGQENV